MRRTAQIIAIFLFISAIFGIVFLVQGCTSDSSGGGTLSGTDGTVTGTVTDSSSGQPISGIIVVIDSIATTTVDDGSYTLNGVSAGTGKTITARCAGYTNYSGAVDVIAGDTISRNFTMSTVPPTSGTLKGKVTNSISGLPVSGVVVVIDGIAATTVSDGGYTLNGIEAGTGKTVSATINGYSDYTGLTDITAGGTTTLDFVLTPTMGTVVGIVTDKDGTAIADVNVSIGAISVKTDSNGAYTLEGVTQGDNAVNAVKDNYGNYAGSVNVAAGATVSHNITMYEKTWTYVGNSGFSPGTITTPPICVYNGTPYVAYRDGENEYKATVMKYNGTTWENVGSAGFTTVEAKYLAFCIFNGTPYIAYRDSANEDKATVMKYNGTSWENVGSPGFSAGTLTDLSLFVYNGTPYLAYRDNANEGKATVMKFNGTTWENVGSPGFSAGGGTAYTQPKSIYVHNGTPYLAYLDVGNDWKATVSKFNGTSWESIGSPGFSDGRIFHISLCFNNDTPYVAYRENDYDGKATVKKFNGTSWENVGSPRFSTGETYNLCLDIYNGTPYVAYSDRDNESKATVMKFNGTTWENVGNAGFSAGAANETYLCVYNGIPYVSYKDGANGDKVSVMKFDVP